MAGPTPCARRAGRRHGQGFQAGARRSRRARQGRQTEAGARREDELLGTARTGRPARRIAALEAQQAELAGKLADGSLYRDAPAEVERINGELAKLESELEEKFARWELLEARRESAL